MSNYLEKYLKYKTKYNQLKIQKGGANLGDHVYMLETGKSDRYLGVIVGFNRSDRIFIVLVLKDVTDLTYSTLNIYDEIFKEWKVNNTNPPKFSTTHVQNCIDQMRQSMTGIEWYTASSSAMGTSVLLSKPRYLAAKSLIASDSLFPPRGMAASGSTASDSLFSSRGMAASGSTARGASASYSPKLTLIELARTNTEFQKFIVELNRDDILTTDLLKRSDLFNHLLTDDAIREMHEYFRQRGQTEWIKVGIEAYERSTSHDQRAVETVIANMQSKRLMMHNCRNCRKLVSFATRCEVTGDYHMDDHGD